MPSWSLTFFIATLLTMPFGVDAAVLAQTPPHRVCEELLNELTVYTQNSPRSVSLGPQHRLPGRIASATARLTQHFQAQGFDPLFLKKLFRRLEDYGAEIKLHVFDLTSEEFREFLKANKPEGLNEMPAVTPAGINGLFYNRQSEAPEMFIGLNPHAQSIGDQRQFEFGLLEELVHARQRAWEYNAMTQEEMPYFMNFDIFRSLVIEYVAKIYLLEVGKGERVDRWGLLRELIEDAKGQPGGYAQYEMFLGSLRGCWQKHRTTLEGLSLSRYLLCLSSAKTAEEFNVLITTP